MVVVSCKLIRVLYAVLTKGIYYDAEKLRNDIIRPQELKELRGQALLTYC